MTSFDDEEIYRIKFLISRYQEREAVPWQSLKESAEQTTEVIRDVVRNLIEHYDQIGDEELTTVFRLCQNSTDGLSARQKQDLVRQLEFPADAIDRIVERIDDSLGSVGSAMQEPKLHVGGEDKHPDAERSLHNCFEQLVHNSDSEEKLVSAARDLVNIDFYGVQSGRMSPILHYLAPEFFPIINGKSSEGMELLLDESVSVQLRDYIDERKRYLEIRDGSDLQAHLRDLDYFLHWVQTDENPWTEVDRKEANRDVWQVQPGSISNSTPEELWPIWTQRGIMSVGFIGDVNNSENEPEKQTANFVSRISPGDIVVAKYGVHDLLALGVATPQGHEYVGGTDKEIQLSTTDYIHQNIRHVEWLFHREVSDRIDTSSWNLTTQFHQQAIVSYNCYEELRWHLASSYQDEILPALRSLESKSVEYATGARVGEHESDVNKESMPDPPDRAREIVRQLEKEKQVVFYGPPGTGKTYTAKRFVKWWIGQQDIDGDIDDRFATVTFHPSFSYEDFVEGLSAKTAADGQVVYEIEDGALKRIRDAAETAREEDPAGDTEPPRYVLIIDEINRGSLAQIFGELITLFEADKRETFSVELAHSGETVTLPPNLYVIGTMNTADQSIALVDTALRRRFRFIDFPPDLDLVWNEEQTSTSDPRTAVTERDETVSRYEQLLGASVLAVQELNDRILSAPDLGKGKQLGHTYLLGHATAIELVDAWRYDILPQLEEYYFGQFDRLQDELLTETSDRLIRWEKERIRSFDAGDLYTALRNVAGVENPAPLAAADQPDTGHSDTHKTDVDSWDAGEKTVSAFRERTQRKLDDESYHRIDRLLSVADDLGRIDTGRGDKNATVMLKNEEIDPGVGLMKITQDGTLQFRWDWLARRDENGLTGEFFDEAADVFSDIDEYDHEWYPDTNDNTVFETKEIRLKYLSESEFEQLIDGLRSVVDRAGSWNE